MKFQLMKYALSNLFDRKMRSALTIVSILIGIMSIFALLSFGLGIQNYVDVLAEEAGADKIFIQSKGIGVPGTDENFFLAREEVDFVSKIKGIDEISGMYFKAGELKFKEETKFNFVIGMVPDKNEFLAESFGVHIEKGRSLKNGDQNKVVLGYSYQFPNKVFERALVLGDKVDLNDVQFEVIGFYNEIGNPGDDANIYIIEKRMEELYPEIVDKFSLVMIRASKSEDPQLLAEKIQEKLRKHLGQDEGKEDFFVQTFADAIATFTNVIAVINGVLVLIALISLIVASVNIINTMYTSILERTKEIGVMKAIGAKNKDIMFIFVFESAMLGALGGVLGVILGYLVASGAGRFASSSGFGALQPIFPIGLIFGCILFAFMIGAFSGLLPAIRASKMNPVDALRYE
tara:strand:+ start:2004 stop:3215 length:1212 start_codon:yes stop_codon:yes gene_type:complete